MKYFLLLIFIIATTFLQSCDERITPKTNDVIVEVPLTAAEILSSHSWQYNEVIIKGGGKTVVQFSRPNSIGLSSDFSTMKISYKSDGSQEIESKGGINRGKWKLSSDGKQLSIVDSNGSGVMFDVLIISKSKLEFSVTFKKIDFKNDAGWETKMKSLGLPVTSTEYVTLFSFVTI